jgi:hypothetical protein
MSTALKQQLDSAITDCEARLQRTKERLREHQDLLFRLDGELHGLRTARKALETELMGKPSSQQRGISTAWLKILGEIAKHGEAGASLDAIDSFIEQNSFGIARNATRSQLSNYKARGFIEQVGEAQYRISLQGTRLLERQQQFNELVSSPKIEV